MYVCMYMHYSHTNNFFIFFQLSIDDLSHYGDAYSTGNQGTAFYNLKVAMEAANSSAVLPSVDLSSSSGNNDELLHLIRKMASGLVKELNPEGKVNGLECVCPCFNFFLPFPTFLSCAALPMVRYKLSWYSIEWVFDLLNEKQMKRVCLHLSCNHFGCHGALKSFVG